MWEKPKKCLRSTELRIQQKPSTPFLGYSGRSVMLMDLLHVVQSLRVREALCPFPRSLRGVMVTHRDKFKITLRGPVRFRRQTKVTHILWEFQVLTAASMKFRLVFWDVLPCKLIVDRRFRGTCCLHHHDGGGTYSETSVDNYFTRQYIPEDNSELQTHILFHKTRAISYIKRSTAKYCYGNQNLSLNFT
jgi:hypothetical protein